MADQDVPVSNCDELSDTAHDRDEVRRVRDFKQTNAPLSKSEIDKKKDGYLGDMTPLPEKPTPPSDID
ncbi:MAG TPA: hypothetical protein VFW44_12665 [Bryobacteraceae bacterium]|nr:hypothetical protein [Bryobacteraceae bacterium]